MQTILQLSEAEEAKALPMLWRHFKRHPALLDGLTSHHRVVATVHGLRLHVETDAGETEALLHPEFSLTCHNILRQEKQIVYNSKGAPSNISSTGEETP